MKLNYIISMVLLSLPFVSINWNFNTEELFPIFGFSLYKISLFYAGLLLAGVILFLRFERSPWKNPLSLTLLATGLLFAVLPMGNGTVLMVAIHLLLVLLIFMVLYNNFLPESTPLEKGMAFLFTALLAAAKGVGLLIMGSLKSKYTVAYGISSVIYLTVIFLLNQLVQYLMKQRNVPYNRNIINAVAAFIGFWALYFLSFKLENDQLSIFKADFIVIVMVALFIFIAVLLYLYLLSRSDEKVPVYISASVFFTSVAVLLISGPWLNRDIHTIVFNILLFVMTGALIYYALHINSTLLANISIGGFTIHIFTRYFDLFWDLLSGSLFIIVTGLLLLMAGFFLEKSRKKIISEIERHAEEEAK
jgi:MFS family permease